MPNIAKIIGAALGKQKDLGFASATLTRKTTGSRTPGELTAGTNPTSTTYPCKAMIEESGTFVDGTTVAAGNALILVLGGTIATVPRAGDIITIRGTAWHVIRRKSSPDPGGAAHECEVAR